MTAPLLHDLKRRVVLHPEDAEARFALGEALYGDGLLPAAARQLEKALAIAPDHGNARRLLVRAYARDNRLAVAERVMREAVQRQPTDASLRDTLAEVLEGAGRIDDALLQLEAAAVLEPEGTERRLRLAAGYARRGNVASARRHLEEAARREPGDARLVSALESLPGPREAALDPALRGREFLLGRAREALAAEPLRDRLEPSGLQAASAALRGSDVAAVKRALVTAPPGPVADFIRAEIALADGDAERSEKALERCVEAWPELAVAWDRLGERRLVRGDGVGALAAAERARAADPKRASARVLRADALAACGRDAEAETAYIEAARDDATGPAAARLAAHRTGRRRAEESARPVGRLGALGWNPYGGIVSMLEAVVVPGRGELQITGNVGDVGRESAKVAFSYVKARAAELGIADGSADRDLHYHYDDMEFAKDGPSAGLALALAAVSAYTRRPLRPLLAASGEVTLHGAVKAVGGIHEKLVAATLHGIRRVILPRRNLFDARDLPAEVTQRLEIVYADSVPEALAEALLEPA